VRLCLLPKLRRTGWQRRGERGWCEVACRCRRCSRLSFLRYAEEASWTGEAVLLCQSVKARGGHLQTARPASSADAASTQDRTQDTDQTLAAQQQRVLWPMIKPLCPAPRDAACFIPAVCRRSSTLPLRGFTSTPSTHYRLRGPSPVMLPVSLRGARHHHCESNNRFRLDMAVPQLPAVARNELPRCSNDARLRCAEL